MTEMEYIEHLKLRANASETKHMNVVDYAGRTDGAGEITIESPPQRRYGLRDSQHVAIYGLTSIYEAGA
ncbi:hypothetical protein [Epibacterium ulvae]|uniref:hypothetical protein n=1 Tax=Epibacterium ulvae TaxID=1156985 RepID=UPI002491A5A7|nr:hypothetical protein [Epibacterium ulvae]